MKNLGSVLVMIAMLSLGAYSAKVTTKLYGPRVNKHQLTGKDKLYPACKQYLERRTTRYRYKGNKAELKESRKVVKVLRSLSHAEQKIQCQAAYRAFDDFDHGKSRRR